MSGSTYVKLPKELQHSKKGLVNNQNFDNKCFLWCHVRHLNCDGKTLWRISGKDREIAESLSYSGIKFPVSKKDYDKISMMNKININVFCYEGKIVFRIYLSDQSFINTLDLLLISNHYVYIKDFNRLMFSKTKCKNKKWFCKSCLQCFSSEKVLIEHGKDCLSINGGQNVKLEKGFIEFKNYSRQIPVPFKIYAHFECLLKNVDFGINIDSMWFCLKLVCIDNKYSKDVVLYTGKNAVFKFIQSIFKEYDYYKKVMKKHFNKNLVMTALDEEEFEFIILVNIEGLHIGVVISI